jgi:cytoskeletal protein CcmA (bactofilin family)
LLLMLSRSRRRILVSGLIAIGCTATPAAAEVTQSDLVFVRPEDIITEDLYAAGNSIRVEGRIEGDLYAVAFNEIVVSGVVTGDVVAIASRVEVTGTIEGSLRVAGGQVLMSGAIGDDMLVASWSTEVGSVGVVGRDLLSWSNRLGMLGSVDRDLAGNVSTLNIAGAVEGRVVVTVGRMRVDPSARIGGDIVYQSRREAEIESADVGGNVIRRTALPANVRLRGLRVLTLTLAVLGLAAMALTITWLWPRRVAATIAQARSGVRTWLTGLAVVVSPFVAAGVLALLVGLSPPEAGIPLALVLLPLVLGLLGVVLVAALVGFVPVAGLIGRRLLPNRSVAAGVLTGMVVLFVALAIPVVSWLAVVVGTPLGIGSWVRHLDLTHDVGPSDSSA